MDLQERGHPPEYFEWLPQDQLPVLHRDITINGLVITFQVLAWLAVAFRIFCRAKLMRQFGWDDAFALSALATTTINTALISNSLKWGLGQHFGYVTRNPDLLGNWYKDYLFMHLSYFLSAGLIKLAILIQYLRLYREAHQRAPRIAYWAIITIVTIWSIVYFFILLFSCSPVSAAWSVSLTVNCRMLLSWYLDVYYDGILTHTVTNMILDYIVLFLPLIFHKYAEFQDRGKKGFIALLVLGTGVATTSAVRLGLIVHYEGGMHPSQDCTWNGPPLLVVSALEIQSALVCASIPIFWPALQQGLGMIRVTREVNLVTEMRNGGSGRNGWKRHSESSETELRALANNENGNCSGPESTESRVFGGKSPYVMGWEVPRSEEDCEAGEQIGNRVTAITGGEKNKTG